MWFWFHKYAISKVENKNYVLTGSFLYKYLFIEVYNTHIAG